MGFYQGYHYKESDICKTSILFTKVCKIVISTFFTSLNIKSGTQRQKISFLSALRKKKLK